MKFSKLLRLLSAVMPVVALLLLMGSDSLTAKTRDTARTEQVGDPEKTEGQAPTIQRTPSGAFESVRNRVSNIDFYSTNYGILFLDILRGRAGGMYPRGTTDAYLFGGGIWFGAQKMVPTNPDDVNSPEALKKMSVISYNPNSGASWMVPGEVTQPYEKSEIDLSGVGINKYRVYFSTDYNSFTGEPLDRIDIENEGAFWPIWDTDPNREMLVDRYVGNYVSDLTKRNRSTFPKGPAIVSGEDIISIFKDTDLSRYEIGEQRAAREGYPLGIEIDQRIYSWGFGQYQNFIYIKYSIVNKSNDTLYDCYMAPALDTDIGQASNDRMSTAILDANQDTLDLGVQWSGVSQGDQGYGYMGADFLESPAVDAEGFIRKDSVVFDNSTQLGLHALRNWVIDIDPRTPQERYEFMEGDNRDADNGEGDKRFLMSTGPFNMLPGDTARVVIGYMIAPAKSSTPDGSWDDMDSLLKLDLFAQKVYDENFLAPRPPDPAIVSWRPLDNGVELQWDEKSERSLDVVEKGLDFAGYIIQRARKPAGSDIIQYDSVVGYNLGYKTIAQIPLPFFPDAFTRYIAADNQSLRTLGPWWRLPMLADTVGGAPAARIVPVDCFDTLRRENGTDSIIVRPGACTDTVFSLAFDPYDDDNDDSTLFNDLSGYWWNNGTWGDRFSNKAIRDIVRDAITEIMDSVTNGRTFIDVGDDNGDGRVLSTPDNLLTNEKLINNIDYYYRVLAYDEGSVEDNTPSKLNSGIIGFNEVRATPEAPPAGLPITPEILSQSGLGGISNVRLVVVDPERLGQLFGGDTIEFEFQPFEAWKPSEGRFLSPLWYLSEVIVRSAKLGELNRFIVPYDPGVNNRPVFSDRANSVRFENLDTALTSRLDSIRKDTVYYEGTPEQKDTTITVTFFVDKRHVVAAYRNTFTTEPGEFAFGTNGITKSTFGLMFDWAGEQYGDSLRFGTFLADSAAIPKRSAMIINTPIDPFEVIGSTNVNLVDDFVAHGRYTDTFSLIRDIPSIGQVKLEIEFVPGGTETLEWTKKNKTYRVDNVPYLIPRVKNIASFNRVAIGPNGEQTQEEVKYDYTFPVDEEFEVRIDTADVTVLRNDVEFNRLVDIGEFGLVAYDWTGTNAMTVTERRRTFDRADPEIAPSDRPIGTPNRYYVGEHTAQNITDGTTTDVRFTHRLIANGGATLIDYAGMGAVRPQFNKYKLPEELAVIVPDPRPTQDIQAGDKIIVSMTGGALGLPQPGAKVAFVIPDPTPGEGEFTDDLLDAVQVVPNPYMIDHLGQRSSSEKIVYFTRLPKICTIQIYTVAGELVQTLEHNAEENVDGRISVKVWDLVTRGGRQAQTELFIARITTPDGAETVKKFAIVVGGFQLTTE